MCEVAGMITAMTAIAGGIGSYASSVQQGQQARANQAYQSAVARSNAEAAQINSQYALDAGKREAEKLDNEKALTLGKLKSTFAANGVEANGSPSDALLSAHTVYDTEKAAVQKDAEKQAWNYQVNANNYLNQASYYDSLSSYGTGPYNELVNSFSSGLRGLYSAISHI